MPNTFAYLMLLIWPAVCAVLFRRLGVERAIVWSILGGYLLLPPRAVFDLPLVPDFDKTSIPNLCALVFCLLIARRRVPVWPRTRLVQVLLLVFLGGAIPTVLTNADPIPFHSIQSAEPVSFVTHSLPGLRLIDVLSVLSSQAITLVPFILGWAFLSSRTGLRELLLALVAGGLVYSVPALMEVRLSPQINTWVYGFFQHDFRQMIRDGGFRPIVFLPHGLWAAFFFMTAVLSSAVLARAADRAARPRFIGAMIWLALVLYLCKSLAPLLYGLALTPVLLITSPRLQVRLAVGFAAVAVFYPILREMGVVPTDRLLAWAMAIDPERAQSLAFRFENEAMLLDRAHERWLFGWGGWGRNLVRDPVAGDILSIPDGEWIIVFGTFGWVGYLSKMGLLALPLVMLLRRARQGAISPLVAGLAIILAITLIDMLINAILTPYAWLIAGAVLGYCEASKTRQPEQRPKTPANRPLLS